MTLQMGQPHVFRMTYADPDGDRPRELTLVAENPSGKTSRVQAAIPRTGDFRTGVLVTWEVPFNQDGTYNIYFEAASTAGRPGVPEVRWPETRAHSIDVVNPVTRWVMLGIGLGVALLFLPMALFFVLRGMSRRVDPGATARVSLLCGVLAAASWYGYLFWQVHSIPTLAIVGVLALAVAFVLATLRK